MSRRLAMPVFVLLVATAGCAPQFDRIETGVMRNHSDIVETQRELALLRLEVAGVDSLLRLGQDMGVQSGARDAARVGQLAQRIDQLILKLDDNAEFMRSLSARVDLLATRAGGSPGGTAAPGAELPAGGAAIPEAGRAIFQAAVRDRSLGNNDLARQGFREFLAKYGQSELADDAAYDLADLDYADKLYADALAQFQAVLTRYPRSELAPSASLKIGYCQLEMGRTEEGRKALEQLIDRYPSSEEAGLARDRLAQIK
jgi:tol-pal system protein YbgF